MTPRVRFILETRCDLAEKPAEGWLWPAPTKAGHVDHSSLKKQHTRAFRLANAAIKERNEKNRSKEKELRPLGALCIPTQVSNAARSVRL
jgi:hypothetical protein